jgi:hypothetical protein
VRASLVLLLLVACAGDDLGTITADVRIDPRLAASDIKSVDIYVFAGHTTNGGTFNCSTLGGGSPALRADVVHRAHSLGALVDTHLEGLAPETGLVLAVDGYPNAAGTGTRNAFGCTDGITVSVGQSTPVTLVLAPAM